MNKKNSLILNKLVTILMLIVLISQNKVYAMSTSVYSNQNTSTNQATSQTEKHVQIQNIAVSHQTDETPSPTEIPSIESNKPTSTPTASLTEENWEIQLPQLGSINYYVNKNIGDNSNLCTAIELPCKDIQETINKAASGDSIYITEGTYTSATGAAVVSITKNLTLSGGWNESFTLQTDYTFIDAQNARGGIDNKTSITSSIDHFHILNGNTSTLSGDGINNYGTFTITNSFVYHNNGTGIYSQSGTLTINNSSIHSNNGTGIKFSKNFILNNSTVSNNSEKGIYNNLSGTGSINNSTITLNGATGIYSNSSKPIYLKNSILAKNKGGSDFYPPYPQQDCYGSIISEGNNIIGIITSGCSVTGATNNNIGVDPKLSTFLTFKGYQPIMANSPAVNSGNSSTCFGTTDQRGMPRVGTCDIGAYEYTTPSALSSVVSMSGDSQSRSIGKPFNQLMHIVALDNSGNPIPGVSFTFTAPSSGASGFFSDTKANSTTVITDSGGVTTTPIFTANNTLGNYVVSALTAGFAPINFNLENIGWYVAQNGNDTNSCTTPLNPCATIDAAIVKAQEGDTIFITAETYTSPSLSVVSITKNTVLSGGWDNTFTSQLGFTTIDGQATKKGISSSGFSLTLDHFEIKNSKPGIYATNSTITIYDSILSNNANTTSGGGLSINGGALTVNNSLINENTATNGAGIYTFNGSVTINNSTISNNNATVYGGGINFGGDYLGTNILTINNSTIAYNSAIRGAGVYRYQYFYQPIYIKNSILAHNQAGDGPNCWIQSNNQYYNGLSHNNIYSDVSGCLISSFGGDQVTNPQITPELTGVIGYFTLLPLSPAIEAGNPTSCLKEDQRGVARPQGGTVCDIGAYESSLPKPIALPAGWVGSISVTSDKNVVAVGRPHIGNEIASYDGFPEGSLTSSVPMLFKDAFGGSYDAALYIQNVDASNTANVIIKFYDSTGALSCIKNDTISPLASKGYWLPSETCLPAGWVGGAVIISDQNIVTIARPHIGAEVMTYNGFSSGALSASIPMLFKDAFGGSYDAAFYIQNTNTSSSASLTIKFYDATGVLSCTKNDTLAPLASKGYWVPSETCLPTGWVGGVVITSDQPIVSVGRPHIGTQITTYNGFSSGALGSFIPMLFKDAFGGTYDSAFYVQNTQNTSTANLIIKFYDTSGNLSCTKNDTLAPFASKGYWVPAESCLPVGWTGSVAITSDQPIVGVGRPHVGSQITTYNGFSTSNLGSFIPMLFRDAFGGSYDAAFYIQNTESTLATVTTKYYNSTGILTCTRTDTIPAFATLGAWSPSVVCAP